MRALKIIFIILGGLLAILFILALIAPKDYKVERSIVINAPQETVMPYLSDLKKNLQWSPWVEKDPNMENVFEGVDGQVGSKNCWKGNDEVGSGCQEIKLITNDRVEMDLKFKEPFENECVAYFQTAPSDSGTSVTWGMTGTSPFPWNAFSLFMNMDKMLGADFEKGLSKLKAMVESENKGGAGASKFEVKEVTMEPRIYIVKKATVEFKDISKFYGENLGQIYQAITAAKLEMTGAPSGIFYKWNEKEMKADLAAGLPVKGNEKTKVAGYDREDIAFGKTLVIDYYGSYDKSADAHYAMDEYMKANKLTQSGPVVEEYITDPMNEPDTTKWLTKIYYPVKGE